MKKIILPVILLVTIAILGGSLAYEIVQRHQDAKRNQQFFIALGVQLYQGLKQGDIEAVKQRLGGDIAANAILYEQQYGPETGTKFATRLSQAKDISADLHAMK